MFGRRSKIEGRKSTPRAPPYSTFDFHPSTIDNNMPWQLQSQFPTRTTRTVSAVSYLEMAIGRDLLVALIREYMDPPGPGSAGESEVTRFCLERIGEKKLRDISARSGRGFDTVKSNVGTWVAIVLVDIYGADNIETLRREENGPPNQKKVRNRAAPWLRSFTPHRLKAAGGRLGAPSFKQFLLAEPFLEDGP